MAKGLNIDFSENENGPSASSAPLLGLFSIIFKHVYWYIQQISGERFLDHWSSDLFLAGEMSSMAVLERQHDGSYKELSRQYSSTLCGLRVSDEYLKFLQKIFGQESVKYLKDTYPTEFSYLQQQLEAKFRDYDATAYPNVSFKFPSVFEECVFAKTGKQIKEVVNASCFKGRLAVIGDKFRCESGVVTTFFSAYCTELVDTIRQVLENPDLVDAPAIVLVGEFSRSPLIHDVVKDAFPSRQVIIPSSPEVAVLTGAVIYVHNLQNASRSVIPKYTYGIAGPIPVKNAPQKQSDSEILVFFPKGQAVKIGDIRYKPSYIVDSGSCSEFEWRLIASSRKFLSTIDDDCTFLATVKLSFPAADKPRRVDVYMIFGVSNITVIVRDLKTGNSKKESINVDTLGHMHNA